MSAVQVRRAVVPIVAAVFIGVMAPVEGSQHSPAEIKKLVVQLRSQDLEVRSAAYEQLADDKAALAHRDAMCSRR
jgi:hypothetical protein